MRYHILTTLLAICSVMSPATAQVKNFVSSCGDRSFSIVWDGNTVKTGSQTEYYTSDANGRTIGWRLVDSSDGTDVSVSLKDGKYILTGTFKGEKVNRTEKSKGNPWFQKIEMNGLGILKGKKDFKYECISARDLKFIVMSATDKGQEKAGGFDCIKIKSTLASGIFSGMWSCWFYFDIKTSEFVVYKSVEGGPGTPETTIVRTDK